MTLFVIMDPVGTIPVFLALTGGRSAAAMRRAAWQAVAVSFGVIVAFAFFGQQILDYLNISLPALQMAGGLPARSDQGAADRTTPRLGFREYRGPRVSAARLRRKGDEQARLGIHPRRTMPPVDAAVGGGRAG